LRQAFACRVRYCGTASRHAHQFFPVISFITSISRSRSATSFFNRAFSASSCFLQAPDVISLERPKAFPPCVDPGLDKKRISPHVLSHTCAMIILQATQHIRKVSL
jgi:hypothetical protein